MNSLSSVNLNMTGVACGHCDLVIADTEADSIQCDGCDRWYHSWRQCSGIKKTIFKLLKKNDSWACKTCIDFCKASSTSQDPRSKLLNDELKEVRDLNRLFFDENKTLLIKIGFLEAKIEELKTNETINNKNCSHSETRPDTSLGNEPRIENSVLSLTKNSESNSGVEPNTSLNFSCLNVHLVADSHGRSLRHRVENKLSVDNVRVSSEIYPGAAMHQYVKNLNVGLGEDCPKQDCFGSKESRLTVIVGGVNDTSLESVRKLVNNIESNEQNKKASHRVLVVETPYRYDNIHFNESIKYQNVELQKLCCRLGWDFVPVNFYLFRKHHTRQGLHLNDSGKDIISSVIVDSIKKCKGHFLE